MKLPKSWTYKGVYVMPATRNASGIRWAAHANGAWLRADTKEGMRRLINDALKES